ncbi:DUF2336 domain-containing protein [Siculibacillus lacustris]|uniref:DUF2336 domain-containing protein n=1 Tax=Siculibacillus lacustris TaxID=1549641 RepID=A0A4Q9VSH2_9HYPH|nr:DUF2336 domain-containing protein [Siculibacillus lacustris]TBW38795.1 DUF2336 domain-containing protein [Siculibacillus lacustris]
MQQIVIPPISEDLARVVERVEHIRGLDADLCERLTRSVAQLWGHAGALCSDDDRASFDRILVRITPEASVDTRLFLSDRLAAVVEPPRGILLVLARDVVEVARPVLENSPALTDADLVEIARSRGAAHMEVIAERRDLSIRVTDVLVLRGDDAVRRVVAGNGGARLSDKGFTRLGLQACNDHVVETRLVRRDDLPDMIVHFLIERGSPEARSELAKRARHALDGDRLGYSALSIRATEDGWLDPYDFVQAAGVLSRLDELRHHLDSFVRKLAQTERFPEIVHVLAAATGLPLDTMKHVMVGLDTEPFVVAARAIGLKVETVGELLATGPWLHRLDARARAAAEAAFHALPTQEARRRLDAWIAAGPRPS